MMYADCSVTVLSSTTVINKKNSVEVTSAGKYVLQVVRLLNPRLSKTVCCAREIISNLQLSLHGERGLITRLLDGTN